MRVGDVAARDEEVAPAAYEVRGVEHRLELGEDVAHRLARLGDAEIRIEQLVGQLRLRRRGPARAAAEIVLEERPVGVRLEIAARPRHRRLDDLVADDEHAVARTGVAEAARRPVGRAEASLVVDRVRPPDRDAERFQEGDEPVELALRRLDQQLRISEPGGQSLHPRRPRPGCCRSRPDGWRGSSRRRGARR